MGRLSPVVAIALIVAIPDVSRALTLQREATSGKQTVMWKYGNWQKDCSPQVGTVRVLAKPQHGKLYPSRETITLKYNRFSPNSTDCIGKRIPGFVVYYTSSPGFRGTDTFQIELTHPNRGADIDNFTVQVK